MFDRISRFPNPEAGAFGWPLKGGGGIPNPRGGARPSTISSIGSFRGEVNRRSSAWCGARLKVRVAGAESSKPRFDPGPGLRRLSPGHPTHVIGLERLLQDYSLSTCPIKKRPPFGLGLTLSLLNRGVALNGVYNGSPMRVHIQLVRFRVRA